MRVSSLLLVGLIGSLPVIQATNIYFQPASGFYVCPEKGMVCNIVGCGHSCSILSNGFEVSTVGDKTVYTSTQANSDISITGGDESGIDCDVSCECQPITQGVGCTVSINDRAEDPFAKGITDADGLVSEVNIDNSSADKVAFVGSLVLSTVVSFLL